MSRIVDKSGRSAICAASSTGHMLWRAMRTRPLRLAITIALAAVLLAGCTAAELASLPREPAAPRSEGNTTKAVRVGDNAIVSLKSGGTLRGEVVAVTSAAITVEQIDNSGRARSTIGSSEIAKLERVTAGNVGWAVLGVTAGAIALLAYGLSQWGLN